MTENEVNPLFNPAAATSGDAEFLCNINGEVSLWRIGKGVGSSIRAYTSDYKGAWINDLQEHDAHLRRLEAFPKFHEHANTLRRNIDVIKLYGAMLEETRSGVG
jgi:hypothetical protein